MAFVHDRAWLFDTIVHENGEYSLFQVILCFRHFSWELLGKTLYSFYLVGAFRFYGRPITQATQQSNNRITSSKTVCLGIVVLLIVAATVLLTTLQVGIKETVTGLAQGRTSELRPPEAGSHWRNHFLSNIVLFSTSSLLILLYRMGWSGARWEKRGFSILLPISAGCFVALTLLFGVTRDPFETPRYLGHQFREIVGSDLSITMLLAMAVLVHLERRHDSLAASRPLQGDPRRSRPLDHITAWLVPLILIPSFLAAKILSLDWEGELGRASRIPRRGVVDVFAWHFYEHILDYVFVSALVGLLYLLTLRAEHQLPQRGRELSS